MTVEDIRRERAKAESQVAETLMALHRATGMTIADISLSFIDTTTFADEKRVVHLSSVRIHFEPI